MVNFNKIDFPVSEIRRFLEPGPIVLISSRWKDRINVMTIGWHTVMEFSPSLVGCIISKTSYSFEMIKKSRECVINIPTAEMAKTVVGIGNLHGGKDVDKFKKFNLTPVPGDIVKAPMVKECYANLECRVVDSSLINKYNFFIMKIEKAHAPKSPKYPRTIHYRGDGNFMVAGPSVSLRKDFKPEHL